MKKILSIVGAVVLVSFSCQEEVREAPIEEQDNNWEEINFFTPDSINIFGDLYVKDKANATILLFHQGGSNARGEYGPIIPRLLDKGFNLLAIDQRVGGQYYGSYNRTLANTPNHSYGEEYGYCDAYNNLDSALDFVIAQGFTGKKILWGSSYSATLAIQLANQRPQEVAGVLAFSPAAGPPMEGCQPTPYLATLKVPLLLLKPPNEAESENGIAQLALAQENGHQTFVPEFGRHGSSMLVPERVGEGVEISWEVVTKFLEKVSRE